MTLLHTLLEASLGPVRTQRVFGELQVPPELLVPPSTSVPRAVLAQALNMMLFDDLLERVPVGRAYVDEVVQGGRQVEFDHGAVRTVRWPSGALPPGEAAVARILRPLGFQVADRYPLPRLQMTGRAWTHQDHPETIAQFFVSELHPERFSTGFQDAVTRVVGDSRDPLSPRDVAWLEELARDGELPLEAAIALLPGLAGCFARHHDVPRLADYEKLAAESAEMAWIATEGNAFNHATDRVPDVEAVAQAQRKLGRPIKDAVEISQSGRVRQTAFKAAEVRREFLADDAVVTRIVPGSFYEFITRGARDVGGARRIDLAFDARNATGIFRMTA